MELQPKTLSFEHVGSPTHLGSSRKNHLSSGITGALTRAFKWLSKGSHTGSIFLVVYVTISMGGG